MNDLAWFEDDEIVDTTTNGTRLKLGALDLSTKSDAHAEVMGVMMASVVEAYAAPRQRKVLRNMSGEDVKWDMVDFVPVTVQMSEEALAYVKSEASWIRQEYMPRGPHDHPVSHHLTEVNEAYVCAQFGKQKFVDVFGNPRRHIKHGRNYAAYTSHRSAKDYIRDFTGCPNTSEFVSMKEIARENPKVKHFLMTHSAYYVGHDDIGELLYGHDDAAVRRRLYAIVHRHEHASGTLNNGELEYSYLDHETVRQVSVATGEGYSHKSMEPFFHQDNVETTCGPIAWTTKKLAGDTYLLEFVAAKGLLGSPSTMTGLETASEERVIDISGTEHYRVLSFWGRSWIQYTGPAGTRTLSDHTLFDILRRFVAGRVRDAQLLKDLTLLCRRLCDKRDIFAKYQSEHDIPPEDLVLYVQAAFHVDLNTEIETMLSFRRANHSKLEQHKRLMEDPSLYDNSWMSTGVSVANKVSRLATNVVGKVTQAALPLAEVASDVGLSFANAPRDAFYGVVPKYRPGVSREAIRLALSVSKSWSEVSKALVVDESLLRDSVGVYVLTEHVVNKTSGYKPKHRKVPDFPKDLK